MNVQNLKRLNLIGQLLSRDLSLFTYRYAIIKLYSPFHCNRSLVIFVFSFPSAGYRTSRDNQQMHTCNLTRIIAALLILRHHQHHRRCHHIVTKNRGKRRHQEAILTFVLSYKPDNSPDWKSKEEIGFRKQTTRAAVTVYENKVRKLLSILNTESPANALVVSVEEHLFMFTNYERLLKL